MWGRLGLRWQVALAVLIPSLVVALFNGFYYPRTQKELGLRRLEERGLAVGMLATEQISLMLEQGGAADVRPPPAPLLKRVEERVFERVDQTGAVSFQAVFTPAGEVVARRGHPPTLKTLASVEEGMCTARQLAEGPLVFCGLPGGNVYVVGMNAAPVVELVRTMRWSSSFVYLGAMLTGLFIAFFIGRAIAEPVTRMTQAAREVAQGDMSLSEVDVASAGEVRMMAHSFNEMLGTLRGTVSELLMRLEQLSSASRGLTGASADQEHVISQQAAYAQQIAATFEELSRTAEQISSSTEVVESSGRFEPLVERRYPNPVPTTVEGVMDRLRSTSFVAALDEGPREDLLDEAAELLDSHPELTGTFAYPHETVLHTCRVRPARTWR